MYGPYPVLLLIPNHDIPKTSRSIYQTSSQAICKIIMNRTICRLSDDHHRCTSFLVRTVLDSQVFPSTIPSVQLYSARVAALWCSSITTAPTSFDLVTSQIDSLFPSFISCPRFSYPENKEPGVSRGESRIDPRVDGYNVLLLLCCCTYFPPCPSFPIVCIVVNPQTLFSLHAEATSAASLGLLLQLVRDLLVRLEELGGTAVEADGLALAEVAFAVRLVDALEGADLDHAV